jgi:RNA polymerase sigma factor (sigma-70 family)
MLRNNAVTVNRFLPSSVARKSGAEEAPFLLRLHLMFMTTETAFETIVTLYQEPLYRFAFSLCRSQADAEDLVQGTFYVWATKGDQLRDPAKVKTWLFTTLHRQFLETRRRQVRFPHFELEQVNAELPPATAPSAGQTHDGAAVLRALATLDEIFQAPLALFYLEDYSYKEIAAILEVPIGTVQSRIARGKAQLHERLTQGFQPAAQSRRALEVVRKTERRQSERVVTTMFPVPVAGVAA